MFHTGVTIEYRERMFNALVRPEAKTDVRLAESEERRQRLAAERAMDSVLADSFPASDPPSWTLGVAPSEPARPAPDEAAHDGVLGGRSSRGGQSDGVIDKTQQ